MPHALLDISAQPSRSLGPLDRWFLDRLRDPRDLHGVHVALAMTLTVLPAAALLFVPGVLSPWTLLAYYVLNFLVFLDRFVLMMHTQIHRPWFHRKHRLLNQWVSLLLATFFGQTLATYVVHHVAMHHAEDNGLADLSTTRHHQRDSPLHLALYVLRFLLIGIPELALYMARRKRWRMFRRLVIGEVVSWSVIAGLMWLAPLPTLAVFVVPILFTRSMMIAGNWAQHAFIDPDDPGNLYRCCTLIVSSRHNQRCFNNGYHVIHHVRQTIHWADMPAEFAEHRDRYREEGAIVFQGIPGFQLLSLMLVLRRYGWLADRVLPLDPAQTRDEIIATLKHRVRPIARS